MSTVTLRQFSDAPTHSATLRGYEARFEQSQYSEAMEWLVASAGGWDSSGKVTPIALAPVASPALAPSDDPSDTLVARALREVRLSRDEEMAARSGFALKAPIYALGRRVNETGIENARTARVEFEAKPLVATACFQLANRVSAERRRDRVVRVRDIAMNEFGDLVIASATPAPVRIEEGAFDSLCSRGGWGGAGYLKSCWPSLRATNVNSWTDMVGRRTDAARHTAVAAGKSSADIEDDRLVFRVRDSSREPSVREVFAVVSETYRPLDADAIAKAVAEAAPPDARGSITYDGRKSRIEVLFHSNVAAEDYGAGEIFRAGVIVRSDDTGSGSIRVSAIVERNLCLNLIVLDRAETSIAGIRHVGDELVAKFRDAFATALKSIEVFAEQWAEAKADELVASSEEENADTRALLAGFAWGAVSRELVPVRGKKPEAVRGILAAYDAEPVKSSSPTRADFVNALTRYAHETAAWSDPWIEDEIQEAAGKILASRKPLPYETPSFAF